MTQRPRKRRTSPGTSSRPGLALITGASAGIGAELARSFASHGHDLVIVARRRARLQALKRELQGDWSVKVRVAECDLADRAARARLAGSLARLPLTCLVNNAGTLEGGGFLDMAPDRLAGMLELNATAMIDLTRRLLPAMVGRGHGQVLNIASIAAFAPVPGLAVYAATKALVLSFGEALGRELDGTGVTVTTVCPGLTESEMADAALERAPALKPYRRLLFAPAASVAAAAYAGCQAGDPLVVPGLANRLYDRLLAVTPRAARRELTGLMNRVWR